MKQKKMAKKVTAIIFMLLHFICKNVLCESEKYKPFLEKYELSTIKELKRDSRYKFPQMEMAERSIEMKVSGKTFILDLYIYYPNEDIDIHYVSTDSKNTGKFQDLNALLYQGQVRDVEKSFIIGYFTKSNLFQGYIMMDEIYCVEPDDEKKKVLVYKFQDVMLPGCKKTDKGDGLNCSQTKYFEPWKPVASPSKQRFNGLELYDRYLQLLSFKQNTYIKDNNTGSKGKTSHHGNKSDADHNDHHKDHHGNTTNHGKDHKNHHDKSNKYDNQGHSKKKYKPLDSDRNKKDDNSEGKFNQSSIDSDTDKDDDDDDKNNFLSYNDYLKSQINKMISNHSSSHLHEGIHSRNVEHHRGIQDNISLKETTKFWVKPLNSSNEKLSDELSKERKENETSNFENRTFNPNKDNETRDSVQKEKYSGENLNNDTGYEEIDFMDSVDNFKRNAILLQLNSTEDIINSKYNKTSDKNIAESEKGSWASNHQGHSKRNHKPLDSDRKKRDYNGEGRSNQSRADLDEDDDNDEDLNSLSINEYLKLQMKIMKLNSSSLLNKTIHSRSAEDNIDIQDNVSLLETTELWVDSLNPSSEKLREELNKEGQENKTSNFENRTFNPNKNNETYDLVRKTKHNTENLNDTNDNSEEIDYMDSNDHFEPNTLILRLHPTEDIIRITYNKTNNTDNNVKYFPENLSMSEFPVEKENTSNVSENKSRKIQKRKKREIHLLDLSLLKQVMAPVNLECALEIIISSAMKKKFNDQTDDLIKNIVTQIALMNELFRKVDLDKGGMPFHSKFRIAEMTLYEDKDADPFEKDGSLKHFTETHSQDKGYCFSIGMVSQLMASGDYVEGYIPKGEGGACVDNRNFLMVSDGRADNPAPMALFFAALIRGVTRGLGANDEDRKCRKGAIPNPMEVLQNDLLAKMVVPEKKYSIFSECNIQEISDTLKEQYCLLKLEDPFCGNAIIDKNEECDCGPDYVCEKLDRCCTPHLSEKKEREIYLQTGLVPKSCVLVEGAQCGLYQQCCSSCNITQEKRICYNGPGTCDKGYCDGKSASCPTGADASDGLICSTQNESLAEPLLCKNKTCDLALCTGYGLTPCTCASGSDTECVYCCLQNGKCQPAEVNLQQAMDKHFPLKDGIACSRGTCSNGECIKEIGLHASNTSRTPFSINKSDRVSDTPFKSMFTTFLLLFTLYLMP